MLKREQVLDIFEERAAGASYREIAAKHKIS